MWKHCLCFAIGLTLVLVCGPARLFPADDAPAVKPAEAAPPKADNVPAGFKRLSPDSEVWFNKEKGEVLADGEICLREGELEMFACTKNTKEHESVVAV